MAQFKARKLKNGLFEIVGLDKFLERRLKQLKRAFGAKGKVAKRTRSVGGDPLALMFKAMSRHPRRNQLVRAGEEKDQLLRSLVPLYVARRLDIEVNSGLISRFWKRYGVKFATPNAAKALRQHVGYARVKGNGRQITPNGIKYVEAEALGRKAA